MGKYAIALAVLLMASACSSGSDLFEVPVPTTDGITTVPRAFDEPVVVEAIAQFLPDGQSCDYLLADRGTPEEDKWGWEVGVDGYERLAARISCDIESEEFWFNHELRIQYPLKTGTAAEWINEQVRDQVAAWIVDYFSQLRERYPTAKRTGEPGERPPKEDWDWPGNLFITGVVHFGEDGLHSVYLATYQNHPYANSTASPVVAMNFDLETDEQFSLSAVFKTDSDWEARLAEIILRREEEMVTYPEMSAYMVPEFLAAIDFTMGPDTLALHAQPYSIWFPDWCCGSSPKHFEIRYEELADHLDPDGPYRHILNN